MISERDLLLVAWPSWHQEKNTSAGNRRELVVKPQGNDAPNGTGRPRERASKRTRRWCP